MRIFYLSVLSGTVGQDIWELLGLSLFFEKPPQLEELCRPTVQLGKAVICLSYFFCSRAGSRVLETLQPILYCAKRLCTFKQANIIVY